jgi:hypothetical protein
VSVPAVTKANNPALFGFLLWFFSAGAGRDSQDDASLWDSGTLV